MNEILKEEIIYQDKICTFTRDTVTFADDSTGHRDVLHLPGAAAVLAFQPDGKALFVSQYRHAVRRQMLEIPAGMIEPGEDPRETARRELQEETGYQAGRMAFLASFYTSPGVVDEVIYLYLAEDLKFVAQHLDRDEFLNVREYSPEEIEELIRSTELADGKSILAYHLWKDRRTGRG